MFYEEKQAKKVLNCNQCNKLYDRSLNLPCGFTICSECSAKGLLKGTSGFQCSLCSQVNHVPDIGFPENQAILMLMTEQPKVVSKSIEVERVIDTFSLSS